MDVLGVVDLMDGQAVHARGGQRDRYAPLRVSGGALIDGDALVLARTYLDRFGLERLYVADLDAIRHGSRQDYLLRALASLGAGVWLDAAVSSPEAAESAMELGIARVIVGLETLTSFDDLARICDTLGSERVAFSLDLRNGTPMGNDTMRDRAPDDLAARAAACGAGAVMVIDLSRVGSRCGVNLAMLARVRSAVPGVSLIAGGGVRATVDLRQAADAGCDGVLLATALHDGSISAVDLSALAGTSTSTFS